MKLQITIMNYMYINDTHLIIPLINVSLYDLLISLKLMDILLYGIFIILLLIIYHLKKEIEKLNEHVKQLEEKYEIEHIKIKAAIQKIDIILKGYDDENTSNIQQINTIFSKLQNQIKLLQIYKN